MRWSVDKGLEQDISVSAKSFLPESPEIPVPRDWSEAFVL